MTNSLRRFTRQNTVLLAGSKQSLEIFCEVIGQEGEALEVLVKHPEPGDTQALPDYATPVALTALALSKAPEVPEVLQQGVETVRQAVEKSDMLMMPTIEVRSFADEIDIQLRSQRLTATQG